MVGKEYLLGMHSMTPFATSFICFECSSLPSEKNSHKYTIFYYIIVYRNEGVRGLYKGMTPYLVHVMPNICLVFFIYEKIVNG